MAPHGLGSFDCELGVSEAGIENFNGSMIRGSPVGKVPASELHGTPKIWSAFYYCQGQCLIKAQYGTA